MRQPASLRALRRRMSTGTAQERTGTYDKLGWMKLAAPAAPNVYCEVCSRLKSHACYCATGQPHTPEFMTPTLHAL